MTSTGPPPRRCTCFATCCVEPRSTPLCVLGTFRSTEPDRSEPFLQFLADTRRIERIRTIHLDGLDTAGIREMLESAHLPAGDVPKTDSSAANDAARRSSPRFDCGQPVLPLRGARAHRGTRGGCNRPGHSVSRQRCRRPAYCSPLRSRDPPPRVRSSIGPSGQPRRAVCGDGCGASAARRCCSRGR